MIFYISKKLLFADIFLFSLCLTYLFNLCSCELI